MNYNHFTIILIKLHRSDNFAIWKRRVVSYGFLHAESESASKNVLLREKWG